VSGSGKHTRPPLHPIPVSRPFQVLGVDIMYLLYQTTMCPCPLPGRPVLGILFFQQDIEISPGVLKMKGRGDVTKY